MLNRLLPLALLLAVPALVACSTVNPKAKMGPQWARYVGSSYRRGYGATGHVTSTARPAASSPAASSPAASMTGSADVELERPVSRATGRSTSGPVAVTIPPRRPGRAPMTVADATSSARPTAREATAAAWARPPVPAPIAPPPANVRPMRTSRHLPRTVVNAAPATPVARNDLASAAVRSPISTAVAGDDRTQRQFLRLKIHGLDSSDTEAPFRVRKMLSDAPGVKEVVFSSKTQTAIVVIEPGTDPDDVRTALAAPYRASILR